MRDLGCKYAAARVVVALLLGGCGNDPSPGPPDGGGPTADACDAGEFLAADACLPAGTQPSGCAAGEVTLDGGGCRAAGVPAEACGSGFAPDGDGGCEAILPLEPCAHGTFAIPGDTRCHDVAACGEGAFGDIPTERDTQYVDGAYPGSDSDGTLAKPWLAIQSAIDAAAPGAIVAIAAGSYVEDLTVRDKPVRLWGRCPGMVEIFGAATINAVLVIREGASATEIHDVAITGPRATMELGSPIVGMLISGAENVLVDRVWIHDVSFRGLVAQTVFGPTSVTVTRTLIEESQEIGLDIHGVSAVIDGVAVRGTGILPGDDVGVGIRVASDRSGGSHPPAWIRSSVIERNATDGIGVIAGEATIEQTVVRDTEQIADDLPHAGISLGNDPDTGQRAKVIVRASVIARNHAYGVFVRGSDAVVEASVIADTQTAMSGFEGRGIDVQYDFGGAQSATLALEHSVVQRNHEAGIMAWASSLTIEGSIVRDTAPPYGLGVAMLNQRGAPRAQATIVSSIIERNGDVGVLLSGAEAIIEGTLVSLSLSSGDGLYGRGVNAQSHQGAPAAAEIRFSALRDNQDIGVFVSGATARIEATRITNTMPRTFDGAFGDGVSCNWGPSPTQCALVNSVIAESARSGATNFGATTSAEMCLFDCNPIHLDGEVYNGVPFHFDDLGGNVCGCAGERADCKVLSANLQPPEAVP